MRNPARGGAPNALFVLAAVENLPGPVANLATRVSVTLPWGSLLDAVWRPCPDRLAALRAVCVEGATLEVVVAYEPSRDHRLAESLGRDPCDLAPLGEAYERAGFAVTGIAALDSVELAADGTTWAKKLAARPGQFAWRLTACAAG